ncbi:hypothetical protein BCR33DRAFT_712193 [Rhizoclosmatium globosum]|uniref:BHLH domain-containing protein n=1 Tax=Rhizoclosmatium globosum TaxID=329046 RepID=A0A1Y2CYF0_9FUNG|nr:hypothetical protein BCR33DRAFT_712193 [Rhizoclosmatium globosum]|eukprot:ORY51987.1 hypothetical protein BCR33DRAFT_712193 [Rhizoclosmatium globosum]
MAGPVRKRETHIASEQRRRQHIKDGFRRLSEQLAWRDEGSGATQRSEVAILQRSIEYIRELLAEQAALADELRGQGKEVPAVAVGTGGGAGTGAAVVVALKQDGADQDSDDD